MLTVQLAFNSHEKETFRIPPDSLNYKFKLRLAEGKSVEEIKEDIVQRNEMRKIVKDVRAAEKSLLKNYRDTPSKSTPRLDRSALEKNQGSASNFFMKRNY